MNENFDPKKIIDFSKDYYSILGVDKKNLPKKNNRDSKVKLSKIVEDAFRKQARKCHPDFGGSKEKFVDLVRARRIIEDSFLKKIYDQGYFEEFSTTGLESNFDVDWTKIGTYRKGTIEDTVGFKLFLEISENKNELGLIPAFFPQSEENNYEWDWIIAGSNNKVVLSLVNDENEVLRLSNSEKIEKSLPFKIYILVPKANLNIIRNSENIESPNGKTLMNGQIDSVQYNDFDLLETTDLNDAVEYIKDKLKSDLDKIKNNTFKNDSSKNTTKWLDTNQINKIDKDQLKNIINFKYFNLENNEKAGDFLDDIE